MSGDFLVNSESRFFGCPKGVGAGSVKILTGVLVHRVA